MPKPCMTSTQNISRNAEVKKKCGKGQTGEKKISSTLAENILHNPGIGCPHFEMPTSEAPEKKKKKLN